MAATKSYIASLAALAHLVAEWTQDAELAAGTARALPMLWSEAWELDWQLRCPCWSKAEHLYVIGRGLGLGLAQERALKAKETCGLHAEAYSGAEVRHGPHRTVGPGISRAWCLRRTMPRAPDSSQLAAELAARGVGVALAGGRADGRCGTADHGVSPRRWRRFPMCRVSTDYSLRWPSPGVEIPMHRLILSKVTETV